MSGRSKARRKRQEMRRWRYDARCAALTGPDPRMSFLVAGLAAMFESLHDLRASFIRGGDTGEPSGIRPGAVLPQGFPLCFRDGRWGFPPDPESSHTMSQIALYRDWPRPNYMGT